MIGRLVGLVVGLAVAAFGVGLWRPAYFKAYVNLKHVALGPFDQYRTIVAGLIFGIGVVIALAAVQRRNSRRKAAAPFVIDSPAEDHVAAAPAMDHAPPDSHDAEHAPAAHAHDDHAPAHDDHDDHASAHDDHGHDDHAPAHDDHGHHGHHSEAEHKEHA